MEFINSYALRKILDRILIEGNKLFGTEESRIVLSSEQTEQKIHFHLNKVLNWSKEISFRDMEEAKSTTETYVDLDFYLTPLKLSHDGNKPKKIYSIKELFNSTDKNIILLGQPGAGKTTSMKYISNLIFYDEEFQRGKIKYPFLIRLREFDREDEIDINSIIYDILGILIWIETDKEDKKGEIFTEKKLIKKHHISQNIELVNFFLSKYLDELQVLLIIDGLDEVPFSSRDKIIKDTSRLCLSLKQSKIILTSRVGDFNYKVDNSKEFEICPLGDNQIKSFTKRWLKGESNKELLMQLKDSPFYDTTMRPLTLAHLCAIYEREKSIPKKPKTVYRKIINLLLEEWDHQNSVIRKSRYSNFEVDRKFEFLANLAYRLNITLNKTVFTRNDFQDIYLEICENFSLPKFESQRVAEELETHSGLFVQSGYDNFEFAHISMQEYLSAEYIVRLPNIPYDRILLSHPHEIAISVVISSNSSFYFSAFCLVYLESFPISHEFTKAFIGRLILEKVDFNFHPILAVAFLRLFSKTIADNKKGIDLNYFDDIFDLSPVKISTHKLNEYYLVDKIQPDLDDGLIQIVNKEYFNNEVVSVLPKTLIAKEIYLLNWG